MASLWRNAPAEAQLVGHDIPAPVQLLHGGTLSSGWCSMCYMHCSRRPVEQPSTDQPTTMPPSPAWAAALPLPLPPCVQWLHIVAMM